MPSISYYPTSNAKNANTLVCDQNSTLYCAVPRHWSQPADNLGDWQSVGKNPGTSQIQNFELIIPVHVVARLGRGCRFVNLGILTCECQVKTEFSLRPICRHEAVSCLLFCRGHSRVATFPCTQIPSSFILLPTPVNQGRLRPGGTLLCVAVPSLCYHSSYLGRSPLDQNHNFALAWAWCFLGENPTLTSSTTQQRSSASYLWTPLFS